MAWQFPAVLSRVVDGDTIILTFDLGFNIQTTIRARLADVNCPELIGDTHVAGLAAKSATIGWLADASVGAPDARWPLTAATRRVDDYGRYLVRVQKAKEPTGESLNTYLVRNGFAVPFDVGKGGV